MSQSIEEKMLCVKGHSDCPIHFTPPASKPLCSKCNKPTEGCECGWQRMFLVAGTLETGMDLSCMIGIVSQIVEVARLQGKQEAIQSAMSVLRKKIDQIDKSRIIEGEKYFSRSEILSIL